MTIEEFYQAADGDYAEALAGLGRDESILKYLRKFADSGMTGKIRTALDGKEYETAFLEAHNLKGMCLNVALTRLLNYSSDLTESLRYGPNGEEEGCYVLVEAEYRRICELIAQLG